MLGHASINVAPVRQNVKATVTSETQLGSSDLATVAECIAYLRDRAPWLCMKSATFSRKKRGGFSIPTKMVS